MRLAADSVRVQRVNGEPVREGGSYVLYWMIAQRRATHNHALDRAVAWAQALGRPLLVLEALRIGYPWASERIHRFVLDGMADNAAAFAAAGVTWYGYVEPTAGAGRGLLTWLAADACVVVTDEFPSFFLPRMVAAAGRQLDVCLEAVDGNGLLPLRANPRAWPSAVTFRRHLQKTLPAHLPDAPAAAPLAALGGRAALIPDAVTARWPRVSEAVLRGQDPAFLSGLDLDHAVRPVPLRGGAVEGAARLERFLRARLPRYAEGRNQVADGAASGLSPYLHFGFVGAYQVFSRVVEVEGWTPDRLAPTATAKREGWWGMSAAAEAFLDEFVTWRELGYAEAFHAPETHDRYEGLPGWARESLAAHAQDPRVPTYDLATLDEARTHDPVWNAAQNELRRTGVMHNYLRMLWGKKVLEWSPSPEEAFRRLVHLNNRYALDGRNPNSYTGISWTLGRYDRPWAPQRPVFGVIRYMSSDATRKKLDLTQYLARYAGGQGTLL